MKHKKRKHKKSCDGRCCMPNKNTHNKSCHCKKCLIKRENKNKNLFRFKKGKKALKEVTNKGGIKTNGNG